MDIGLVLSVVATVIVLVTGVVLAVRTHDKPEPPDDRPWQETSGGGGGG